ncbi:deoxyribodipyrimidine photo-lyase [Tersicoccus solisilvae]|uniref:Deoxyribodipyrimidine photo-lyase n=1 Tax=Tersicoccus solisilvae TaxID=1882339 RepID=A0ABQ1P0B6_9MICC|nr:deoxyribodipyrimidine photo-lyase [Tersicoccus solisilvae]GGC87740.1 deoxyribodipyrimidine photo-lyase [Tersicoccus solisilvae]
MTTTVVWLRDDLRLADNPALRHAADDGDVVVLYVLDEASAGVRSLGGAARWWLHHSLAALGAAVEAAGARLVLRRGAAIEVVPAVIQDARADAVVWNRRYGGPEREIDAAVKTWAGEHDVEAHSFAANLLHEPWTITTGAGEPFQVYSPFLRACQRAEEPRDPLPAVRRLAGPDVASDDLDEWGLHPSAPDWSAGLAEAWEPGETGATRRLTQFVDGILDGYDASRERPGVEGTSRLSPHLRFGEVSPFQVRAAVAGASPREDRDAFLSEIHWREFNWHLLYANPDLATVNHRAKFDGMRWRRSPGDLRAWQRGRTGYPLVDAGMRQLWQTGWMHNRVRMITASFLIKNLLIDWRAGEQWFWDTLVDADAANNPANWQWTAGSGADAFPYVRVFNPVTQGRKFDADGSYITRFVPELAGRDGSALHEPWDHDPPADYPEPMVDLRRTRRRALAAYDDIGASGR